MGTDLFKYISQINDHVYLLLPELQKVHSHIVHYLLEFSVFLKQIGVMNGVVYNVNNGI